MKELNIIMPKEIKNNDWIKWVNNKARKLCQEKSLEFKDTHIFVKLPEERRFFIKYSNYENFLSYP